MKRETEMNRLNTQHLSRREFLGRAAALGAALLVLPSCSSSSQPKVTNDPGDRGPRSGENKMKMRKLGQLEVSELAAGCMSISANYGPPAPRDQGIKVIRTAFDNCQ